MKRCVPLLMTAQVNYETRYCNQTEYFPPGFNVIFNIIEYQTCDSHTHSVTGDKIKLS